MRKLILLLFVVQVIALSAEQGLSLLPADTRLYIHADIIRVLQSQLAGELIRQKPWIADIIRQVRDGSGIELRRDLDFFLLGASQDSLGKITFIVGGRFTAQQVESYLPYFTSSAPQVFDNVKVFRVEREGKKIYLGCPKDGLLVGAFDWLYLCRELEVIKGKHPGAGNSALARKAPLKHIGGISAGGIEAGIFFSNVNQFQNIREVDIGIPFGAESLSAVMRLSFDSVQSTKNTFELAKAVAQLKIDSIKIHSATGNENRNKPEDEIRALKKIIGSVTFIQQGRELKVTADAAYEDILKLLESLTPALVSGKNQ